MVYMFLSSYVCFHFSVFSKLTGTKRSTQRVQVFAHHKTCQHCHHHVTIFTRNPRSNGLHLPTHTQEEEEDRWKHLEKLLKVLTNLRKTKIGRIKSNIEGAMLCCSSSSPLLDFSFLAFLSSSLSTPGKTLLLQMFLTYFRQSC